MKHSDSIRITSSTDGIPPFRAEYQRELWRNRGNSERCAEFTLGTTCLMSSFPTTVTATSVRGMVLEVMARTEVFNAFKRGRAAIMKVTGNGVEVA